MVLFSFSILSMSSAWIWITWSPVASLAAQFWDVSLRQIDGLSAIYLYVYVPVSFLSMYLTVNCLGLQAGLLVGAAFNAVGAWLRYYYLSSYYGVYIGTVLCAVAQTFTLSTPPLIAGNWFGADERATATALGVLANQLGTAAGLGATIVIDFTDEEEALDTDTVQRYLLLQLYVALAGFVLVACFGGDKPKTPPSIASSMRDSGAATTSTRHLDGKTNTPTYFESIRRILGTKRSISFVLSFGAGVGIFYTIPTFISQLVPSDFSASTNGWLGVSYQAVGALGSYSCGKWVDKAKNHREMSIVLLTSCTIFLVVLCLSFSLSQLGVVIGFIGTGVTMAAWNTVGLELGTGLAYPADEAAVAAILESAAELCGFVWVCMGGLLVETSPASFCGILSLVMAGCLRLLCWSRAEVSRPLD